MCVCALVFYYLLFCDQCFRRSNNNMNITEHTIFTSHGTCDFCFVLLDDCMQRGMKCTLLLRNVSTRCAWPKWGKSYLVAFSGTECLQFYRCRFPSNNWNPQIDLTIWNERWSLEFVLIHNKEKKWRNLWGRGNEHMFKLKKKGERDRAHAKT